MFNRKSMEAWVRKRLYGASPNGVVTRFTLRHLVPVKGFGNSLLEEVSVPDDAVRDGVMFVEEVVSTLESTAEGDASNVAGMQTYVVTAEFSEGGVPLTFKFQHGEPHDIEDFGRSEPANEKGVASMLMRHLEARERATWGIVGTTMQRLMQSNDALGAQLDRMNGERLDMFKTLEDMASERHVRELEAKREDASIANKAALMDKVQTLLPVLVHKITGKPLMGPATPAEAMLDSLLESIKPAQLESLAAGSGLTAEQQIVLFSLFEDHEKRKAAKSKALPPKPETAG